MGDGRGTVRLPVLQKMHLSNFTLYRNREDISLEFGSGVFCLAGANGLGKSTFLAILNYAITGIVSSPDQRFQSDAEYYKASLNYAKEKYFSGRIEELYRPTAEVTLEFTVGEAHYQVTRGFFEPRALRRLSIRDPEGDFSAVAGEADDMTANRLHDEYVDSILRHAGLAGFEQLVFLQHFLVTFDERRHLIFWDPEVALNALYLVFGVDPGQASNATEWRRRAERYESLARNKQYQATQARQNMNDVLKRVAPAEALDPDLLAQHEALQGAADQAKRDADDKEAVVGDARLRVSVASAEMASLRRDYDALFSARFAEPTSPSSHALIAQLLNDHECGICGQSSEGSANAAQAALAENKCPLCYLDLPSHDAAHAPEAFAKLQEVDERMAESREQLKGAQQGLERLTAELEVQREHLAAAIARLREFERENASRIKNGKVSTSEGSLAQIVQQYENEIADATRQRDELRLKRDEFRRKLDPIQRELAARYSAAELEFVPLFQRLAYQFLGLDLQVQLQDRASGPKLVLTINGTRRRETTQLSESQQYFVDIALRMALVQYLVGDSGIACMFVDTPEGSLDIAYEGRAGQMFGRFVESGNQLIMTANINASQLVLRLAEEAGPEAMHVERMTNWAPLSEVQAESEALFDRAYARIEGALKGTSGE